MPFILQISRVLTRNIARGSYQQTINCFGVSEQCVLSAGRLLEFIVPMFPVDTVLSVGTTPGGTELLDNEPIVAGTRNPIQLGYVVGGGFETIYFTGCVLGGTIDIYRF